jgi:enolase
MRISEITACEILDSRGNPTIEAQVRLENGAVGSAKVPSGASTGIHEALELRDGGKRYGGKGVLKAVRNVKTHIAQILRGVDAYDQKRCDTLMIELDGTPNKKRLGANAILAVSLAVARAASLSKGIPLYKHVSDLFGGANTAWVMPQPTMNIINGGRHATNGLSIQEFMIIPRHTLLSERIRMGVEIFHALQHILIKKKLSTGVGDEGGFSPVLAGNDQALKLIIQAIVTAGYVPGKQVMLGLDVAASEFYDKGRYAFFDAKTWWSAEQVISLLTRWIARYPLMSIEDPLAEDDWKNWAKITDKIGKKTVLVGDDLFVTNQERLARGVAQGVANAVLIKVNQIGTLSETLDTIRLAKNNKYAVSVSHRSGETADTFIADLAVGVRADFIKSGSLSRSERTEKYNRLMEIERELLKK